jgi:hypothetical protein
MSEDMEHYHREREDQGLANRLINAMTVNDNVVCAAARAWASC